MKITLLILCITYLGMCISAQAQPSFNCNKANSETEKTICNSQELSLQDKKLSALYETILKGLSKQEQQQLKSDQKSWLKLREQTCGAIENSEKCLADIYRDRQIILAAKRAFDSGSFNQQNKTLKIRRLTPTGEDVNAGSEIVFQFDQPVVPIGKMERDASEIPVTISPQVNCEWRWLNTSSLACRLKNSEKLKLATRYNVVMRPGIQTESGAKLSKTFKASFTTKRPRVTYTRFKHWLTPETPLIAVTFNQPVTKDSVESSLYFGPKKIKLHAFENNIHRTLPWRQAIDLSKNPEKTDDQLKILDGKEARRVWVVEPEVPLESDAEIQLIVKPGLISAHGPIKGEEDRVVVSFATYPDFKFLGVRCTPVNERRSIVIHVDTLTSYKENGSELKRCAPLKSIGLLFSSPVLNSTIKDHVTFSPLLSGDLKDFDPWENKNDWSRLSYSYRRGKTFVVWLPQNLKAFEKYFISSDLNALVDEFNRPLKSPIDIALFTDHREPRLVMNHYEAVLEKDIDSDVPLYVTNLNKIDIQYSKLTSKSAASAETKEIPVQPIEDIAYSIPLTARELLDDESGIFFGALFPDPPPPYWNKLESLVQVTPFQVHFKLGHFNSMAWVTKFSDGKPVKDARVSLLKGSYKNIPELIDLDVTNNTGNNGIAMLPGLEEIDPNLSLINTTGRHRTGYFLKVETDDDIAVMPLNWSFSVVDYSVYPSLRQKRGHTHSWGTTAQGVYKLGDTIQYKIYVRDQSNKHWVSPLKTGYQLKVIDPTGKTIHELKDVALNEFGAFDGEFIVPEQAAVGWYRFNLISPARAEINQPRYQYQPMQVLVSDFTPSPFKVSTDLNGEVFSSEEKVEVTSLARLHAGGPFTDAEIRVTASLTPKLFATKNPKVKGFKFGNANNQYKTTLLNIRETLNEKGEHATDFVLPSTNIQYGEISVESAVKDDRGKSVASSKKAEFSGRDYYVGLKNSKWLYQKGKKSKLEVAVVDKFDNLIEGVDVAIDIFHREYKVSRVKGPGNAYLTQNIMEWVKESSCSIKSLSDISTCEFTTQHPGYYQFVATIKDSKQRIHSSTLYGWSVGEGVVVWDQRNDSTLQIVAEQTEYKIGDTARFLVKNPYPGAEALITVERYGVLDSWTQTLKTSTPVIEIPVKPDYLPGFYLSVVAVSPRVDKPIGPNNVDLGKPAYRIGYIEARVSDPFKEIDFKISTDNDVYKPREKVKAKIKNCR